MNQPEYYTIDYLGTRIREEVRYYPLWLLPLILLRKAFRRISPIAPNSAFLFPHVFADVEVQETDIPSRFAEALRAPADELIKLGFRAIARRRSYGEIPTPSVFAVDLLSPDGTAGATLRALVNRLDQEAEMHTDITIFRIAGETGLIGVTDQKQTLDHRPGVQLDHRSNLSPAELWQHFQTSCNGAEGRQLDEDSLKQRILIQLQEQIRHYLARGLYRKITDKELEILQGKERDPRQPPPLPGQPPPDRASRRARARELRPPTRHQRLDLIAKFAIAGGLLTFFSMAHHDSSGEMDLGEQEFIYILMLISGFACAGFLFVLTCSMLRIWLISGASYAQLKRKLRQPPLKLREQKSPETSQIALMFIFSFVLWSVCIVTKLFY